MYAYFKGKIEYKEADAVIVDVNNIGYRIYTSAADLNSLMAGQTATLYTYTCVREDAFILYGFVSRDELELFKLLITVSGIGPKMALSILANDITSVKLAIITQDAKLLSQTPGIGAKTAGRIILELKDKLKSEDILANISGENGDDQSGSEALLLRKEAMEAMTESFGFTPLEVADALNKINIDKDSRIEEIITKLLGMLGNF